VAGKVTPSFAYGICAPPGDPFLEDEGNTLGALAFGTTTEAFLTRSLGLFTEHFPNHKNDFN